MTYATKLRKTAEDASSQAVMFCLMDVSGSMDQATKDMAKRFLYPAVSVPQPDL
ncbi:YeaH/YhbH family protein [Klebsiella pneumoniae]|nr:YeaH/YhbH family protein [Klebsiella pneumoniae]